MSKYNWLGGTESVEPLGVGGKVAGLLGWRHMEVAPVLKGLMLKKQTCLQLSYPWTPSTDVLECKDGNQTY